ncbi:Arginine pathway regulatory protein ArgR, repressor of arg regulon [Candidatus Paraburkholderia calva]|nr:Arginine pathway regulatory protein ArgR, repressor of arg regulon [Candidatus Paraburkholderia calva]
MTDAPLRVAIIAMPPLSMSGLGSVIDSLALANEIDGRLLYEWRIHTHDGHALRLAGGAQLPTDAFHGDIRCNWLIVMTEHYVPLADQTRFLAHLARVACGTACVSSIHHGTWWLAMTGRLAGHRVAVNWETHHEFAHRFADIAVTRQIFEIDRARGTCSGGQASIDFMLAMIAHHNGQDLAERIADALGAGVLRAGGETQRMPRAATPDERDARLADALQLMQANLEEPLTTDDIAGLVGISRRQLERLFRHHLGAMPSKYYLSLRLNAARAQLLRTSQSVVQISLACEFASAAHFSNTYRERFGVTPREEHCNFIEKLCDPR